MATIKLAKQWSWILAAVGLGTAIVLLGHQPADTRDAGQPLEPEPIVAHSSSAERFASLDQAAAAADAVVVAAVIKIEPGRTVTTGDLVVPFTNVSMKVLDSLAGTLAPGTIITVEQTGGETPRGRLILAEDPPYSVGDVSLLLLRQIPAGFRIVSPEGRFSVRDGKLVPALPHGLGDAWRDRMLSDVVSAYGSNRTR